MSDGSFPVGVVFQTGSFLAITSDRIIQVPFAFPSPTQLAGLDAQTDRLSRPVHIDDTCVLVGTRSFRGNPFFNQIVNVAAAPPERLLASPAPGDPTDIVLTDAGTLVAFGTHGQAMVFSLGAGCTLTAPAIDGPTRSLNPAIAAAFVGDDLAISTDARDLLRLPAAGAP